MVFLFSLVIALTSTFAVAAVDPSQIAELAKAAKISVAASEKRPEIYVYSDGKSTFGTNLTLWGHDLFRTEPAYLVAGRFYDGKTKTFLSDWKIVEENTRGIRYDTTFRFSMEIRSEKASQAYQDLRDLILVLSVNQSPGKFTPTHIVDVASFCTTLPDVFVNTTSGDQGCK